MSKRTFTLQSLTGLLKSLGVPVSRYGKGIAKSLEDLYTSLVLKEIVLEFVFEKVKRGMRLIPLLICRKVKVDVYCLVDGVLWHLIEGDQTLEDGRTRGRSWKRSASEKIGYGESYLAAARRCLEEELGLVFTTLTMPTFYLFEQYYARPRHSNSFPGTLVEGKRYRVVTELHPDLFDPKGYYEYKNGKVRTHFRWERADALWDMKTAVAA